MKVSATCFLKDDQGATGIEYALIAGLVSIVVVLGVATVGDNLMSLYDMVAEKVGATAP